ncbi:membrane protein insertase YidC [Neisseria sp. Dent CA1/247]|uniref:Membrane protein insertase YidC n=1 Tax=Neisseria zoodegmatis TaxID=326523 RepID=A0AB38DTT8_9NEIS|nr:MULTISPECIES: membrane protein insertase YidC [Neisseria]OSI10189.1 membrane protein insertase YidC [Neisseria zoodegmatis]UOO77225.1 membrane protein insertase YidC [Neisseria sp. Dent CA1/247]SNU80815.1 inner membrane protein translocase component YidC [Neisseria zoodegmatis]
MEAKRYVIFFALAAAILFGWEQMFPTPKPNPAQQQAVQNQAAPTQAVPAAAAALTPSVPVTVTTDTVKAVIDEKTGDLRGLTLLKYNASSDESKDFVLFNDSKAYTYVAQSELLNSDGHNVLKDVAFTAPQKQYTLNGDKVEVRLTAPETAGLNINKIYTFTKGSYLIDVRYDVTNNSGAPVKLDAVYRLLRDNSKPEGEGYFNQTYAGPVVYTPAGEFEKVPFDDLDDDYQSGKDQAEYVRKTDSGWLGMIQHYFMSTWILQPKDGKTVCAAGACQIDLKRRSDNLYSASVRVPMPAVQSGSKLDFPIGLYAGPQTTSVISQVADNLQLAKDYGKVHIFASPLFWLLDKLHGFVGNWGWAIVLLTIIVKAILYPLTNASYRSMAKMRAVAPRLQALKEKYGDDRMAMQQAMMQMYKDEKINPLGGCLPMLLQIPVFIGLYWAIFSSVELRQAPWMGWITDLSRPDPWFILPIIMAATMFIQTYLNPPPTDPMQAKMMKIMPIIFSVMFFFFPAGLVLYWVVNNILTIFQQWYINKSIEKQRAAGEVVS